MGKSRNIVQREHAWLYDVNNIEPVVKRYLIEKGVNVHLTSRVVDVDFSKKRINAIYLSDGSKVEGDVFVETTGGTGPMGNCAKYGNGCSMCVLRCPSFGPRVSLTKCCGLDDFIGERSPEVYGAFSGSCKLAKESLSEEIREELDRNGVVVLKIPEEDVNLDKLKQKVCQQYALKEFAENVVLLDTGHAKLMTSYYPIEKLRKIKGLENAKYVDPYAGGKGNSLRYFSIAHRKNDMSAIGVENLFVAGEKAGLFVGHTEAICTGTLAGHNAARMAFGKSTLVLPKDLAIGEIISYANYCLLTKKDKISKCTFAGSVFFNRMKKLKLYTIDTAEIMKRVKKAELLDVFEERF